MYEIVQINRIRAVVNIIDEEFEEIESHKLVIEDQGYPNNSINLFETYPDLQGENLKNKIKI